MSTNIDQPTAVIADAHKRWQRNRDVIEGADAVKDRGEAYLPRLYQQNDAEYAAYKLGVPFFPGAATTHEGLIGMVNRKPASMDVPPALKPVLDTITISGQTIDDLAEEVLSETLITNFTGLLVDHPAPVAGLNAVNAVKRGFRPFVAVYRAESILEATPAVIDNRQQLVHVRLLDDADTVRQLLLLDGRYTVIIHRRVGDQWLADDPITPMQNGAPMASIPFVLVATKPRHFAPVKAPLDDIVRSNLDHYLVTAQHSLARIWSSNPLLVAKGVDPTENPVNIVPGNIIFLPTVENLETDIDWKEYQGTGMSDLRQAMVDIKDDMSQVGLSILASEKKAAEAAETHAIRRASENSRTASLARIVSRKIEEAVQIVADWIPIAGTISYSLSTDYLPTPMSAQDVDAVAKMVAGNLLSRETAHEIWQEGDFIPASLTYEEEKARLDQDRADAPPVTSLMDDAPASVETDIDASE
jgi:hypothetical protein